MARSRSLDGHQDAKLADDGALAAVPVRVDGEQEAVELALLPQSKSRKPGREDIGG